MSAYGELGFVNTRDMLSAAYRGGYAVPAFNFVCLEQMLAIVEACVETRSPFILQCSANVRSYVGPLMVLRMAQGCVDTMRRAGAALPFPENIELTRRVVERAHDSGVSVEGELGVLSGVEESAGSAETSYTDPRKAIEFVNETGVDSLAVSIGTSHGIVKMRREKGGALPALRFDIVEKIRQGLPGFPSCFTAHRPSCPGTSRW